MSVELKDAATIVLLRDAPEGLQVLLGKRGRQTRFSAGAFVFPGGAVDAADRRAIRYCRGLDAGDCAQRFGDPAALRFYLAAARELFEEAGIWLFSAQRPENWRQLQRDLHQQRRSLEEVLAQLPEGFDCRVLQYFRFWTTPPGMPRRYRTRFFVARAPQDQDVRVDGCELTEHCWIRPEQMLERHAQQQVELIFPTIKELAALQAFADVDEALSTLAGLETVEEIRTRHEIRDGRLVRVLMPGEPGYEHLPAW